MWCDLWNLFVCCLFALGFVFVFFFALPWFSAAAAKSLQSCLTLCDPIDDSPPGSSLPGILQARILFSESDTKDRSNKWFVNILFVLVQRDHSHLKLWCLSTQGTQRNTVKKIICSKRMWWFRNRTSLLSVNRLTVQKARYPSGCGRNLSCEILGRGGLDYILLALFEWMEQKLRINQLSSKPCFILWF